VTDQQLIERVMTNHWDMAACPCVVCGYGRARGWSARIEYLGESDPHSIGAPLEPPSQGKVE
jgi:hypothetical protein